jgi:hypothetical protein
MPHLLGAAFFVSKNHYFKGDEQEAKTEPNFTFAKPWTVNRCAGRWKLWRDLVHRLQ